MELILDSELENVSGGNAVVAAVVGAIGTVVGAVIVKARATRAVESSPVSAL